MNLAFQFEYNDKIFVPLPPILNFTGQHPNQDNIILFDGAEKSSLEKAGLPSAVWRVRQIAYDIANGQITQTTLTLEMRDKKQERSQSSNPNN